MADFRFWPNLQAKWRQQEKEEEEHRKLQESMLTVRVRLNYPFPSIVKNQKGENLDVLKYKRQIVDDFVEYVTEISRYQTIATVFNQALDFFTERAKSYGLTISRNTSRMIFYERNNTLRRIFASKADMEKKLRCVFDPQMVEPHPLYVIKFLLDSRIASVPFPIEPSGGILLQIQRVDIAKRTTVPELCVYIPPGEPVIRTKLIVGQQFRDDQREVLAARLVLESKTKENEFVNIDGGNMNGKIFSDLIKEYVGNSTAIVYYDGGLRQMCSNETIEATEADRKLPFEKSTMFEILDRKYFASILNVRLPSQEEINRAASVSGAYHGPTWAETVGANAAIYEEEREEDVIREEENEMRIDLSGVEIPKEDNEEIPSGRASTVSMGSDDLTGLVSGSFCNNTPQMSPSVSENEYGGCGERGEISSFELKNQLNAEMTINYVYNSHDNHNYMRINESANYESRKGDIEGESLSSGGQSTLVPTASSIIASSSSSSGDGRIIVVSANETHRVLDIDSRLKVGELKKWISTQLNIDTSQFVIFINTSESCDRGYESHAKDDEIVPNAFQSSTISVKLRPPLKIDEKMIQVVQFDMNENVREKWKTLFEVPASQKSLIGDIMLQCLRMYKEIYGVELTPQQVRMRDIPFYSNHNGGVLSPNQTLDERDTTWNTTLYLQIISDENLFGKPGVPLLVRRFRPSTVEVSPTHEIMVNPKAENQVLSFFEGISKYSQIPVDRIAVTDLKTYSWTKWPYWKNRLELLEGSMFVKDLHKADEKDYIARVGVRVIYYKDSEEVAKILSEEERKQIKIKENGQVESANRRKERPLRIQMSSVSEA
ncbi:unnamed protein product [Caenorhabditis angaria]|uniref:Ubiquitin carboxyl-terminal hydrolase 47 C-terminal domain-containing protein n=1 Tax=Caenorhabditis angaria TaxID=860376 RepID=A0A9P1MYC2_9PELO|nr:unnamed protein product [Caenorhabditis angaria]